MKTLRRLLTGSVLAAVLFLYGCDATDIDTTPPSPPTNVKTFAGDGRVDVVWDDSPERDVAGYNVYYATSYWGEYNLIGNTPNNYFVDDEAVNGDIYYYGVAAYDENGNESELSYDEVYGVARPEGLNESVFDYLSFPNSAGYDFSKYLVCAYNAQSNDASADFFFENFEGTYYINVWSDSEIQDMGPTTDIYDITRAPVGGWVPLVQGENVKYVQAAAGKTYVILTWDNHYAKIRIKEITSTRMIFDWAYQLIPGERMLKRNNLKRAIHTENVISDKRSGSLQ